MPPLLMTGFAQFRLPPRALRAAARGASCPEADLVSTGRVTDWDLLTLKSSVIPGAPEWADRTLTASVAAAASKVQQSLSCTDCTDVGFYGITDTGDPDLLTGLLRRQDDQGYEQLTASGWTAYTPRADEHVEILSRELAGDLAEAITAGASGLLRRYWWPKAFLPPAPITAAVDGKEAVKALPEDPEGTTDAGWVSYAVVDDLDPGAVLELIKLRRGPAGPELVAYRNGVWGEAPEVLTDLQGVQPPPLVELNQAQVASVVAQIGGEDTVEGASAEAEDRVDPQTAAGDKKHTLPEGGFPIDNRDDLKKAVAAYGRAKNPNAAKRHIIKRARELNAIGVLPESWGVTAAGAMVADAPLTVSPDPRAEKLRRYWSPGGKGGAKIRWGTPGDWTRCYRQLRKYMGVRAKGYCQNLHKRNTGQWAGSRGNRGRAASLAAAGSPPTVQSMEAALVAAMSTGRWIGPGGVNGMLKDGIYAEAGENGGLMKTLTAGGFPVAPPDEWFADPKLDGPTPLTVDDNGRVSGHIATFDIAHIGLPGRVHAPRSKSGYAYFRTGQLVTASGAKVNVGQLTLAGGHAPLSADASAAVAHYDNTASAVADVNCGEDRFGIWVAGALRPEVTPSQLRVLRASAPSGDWRPINGNLEMVAVCQVNVPGFPTTRARVASGAITALVAAGARPLAARRLALLADAEMAERLTALEAHVYGLETGPDLVDGEEPVLADGEEVPEGSVTEGTPEPEAAPEPSDAVKRARALAAERRAQREAQASEAPGGEEAPEPDEEDGEEPQQGGEEEEQPAEQPVTDPAPTSTPGERQGEVPAEDPVRDERAARMAALRERVHGNANREPVAAGAGRGN